MTRETSGTPLHLRGILHEDVLRRILALRDGEGSAGFFPSSTSSSPSPTLSRTNKNSTIGVASSGRRRTRRGHDTIPPADRSPPRLLDATTLTTLDQERRALVDRTASLQQVWHKTFSGQLNCHSASRKESMPDDLFFSPPLPPPPRTSRPFPPGTPATQTKLMPIQTSNKMGAFMTSAAGWFYYRQRADCHHTSVLEERALQRWVDWLHRRRLGQSRELRVRASMTKFRQRRAIRRIYTVTCEWQRQRLAMLRGTGVEGATPTVSRRLLPRLFLSTPANLIPLASRNEACILETGVSVRAGIPLPLQKGFRRWRRWSARHAYYRALKEYAAHHVLFPALIQRGFHALEFNNKKARRRAFLARTRALDRFVDEKRQRRRLRLWRSWTEQRRDQSVATGKGDLWWDLRRKEKGLEYWEASWCQHRRDERGRLRAMDTWWAGRKVRRATYTWVDRFLGHCRRERGRIRRAAAWWAGERAWGQWRRRIRRRYEKREQERSLQEGASQVHKRRVLRKAFIIRWWNGWVHGVRHQSKAQEALGQRKHARVGGAKGVKGWKMFWARKLIRRALASSVTREGWKVEGRKMSEVFETGHACVDSNGSRRMSETLQFCLLKCGTGGVEWERERERVGAQARGSGYHDIRTLRSAWFSWKRRTGARKHARTISEHVFRALDPLCRRSPSGGGEDTFLQKGPEGAPFPSFPPSMEDGGAEHSFQGGGQKSPWTVPPLLDPSSLVLSPEPFLPLMPALPRLEAAYHRLTRMRMERAWAQWCAYCIRRTRCRAGRALSSCHWNHRRWALLRRAWELARATREGAWRTFQGTVLPFRLRRAWQAWIQRHRTKIQARAQMSFLVTRHVERKALGRGVRELREAVGRKRRNRQGLVQAVELWDGGEGLTGKRRRQWRRRKLAKAFRRWGVIYWRQKAVRQVMQIRNSVTLSRVLYGWAHALREKFGMEWADGVTRRLLRRWCRWKEARKERRRRWEEHFLMCVVLGGKQRGLRKWFQWWQEVKVVKNCVADRETRVKRSLSALRCFQAMRTWRETVLEKKRRRAEVASRETVYYWQRVMREAFFKWAIRSREQGRQWRWGQVAARWHARRALQTSVRCRWRRWVDKEGESSIRRRRLSRMEARAARWRVGRVVVRWQRWSYWQEFGRAQVAMAIRYERKGRWEGHVGKGQGQRVSGRVFFHSLKRAICLQRRQRQALTTGEQGNRVLRLSHGWEQWTQLTLRRRWGHLEDYMEAIWRRGRVKAFLWRWIEGQHRRREGKLVSALTDEVRAYRLGCASEGEEATRNGTARDAQHKEEKGGVLRQLGEELELFSHHPPSQHQQALPQPRRPQPRPRLDDRGRGAERDGDDVVRHRSERVIRRKRRKNIAL